MVCFPPPEFSPPLCFSLKKPDVRNVSACDSGARNGRANLWAPGTFWFFLQENPPMPIKFYLFGGALGFFRRGGGGSANFILMGAGSFFDVWCP